jgi:hypothetical protein
MVHGLGKWTCTPGGGDWRGGEYPKYEYFYHPFIRQRIQFAHQHIAYIHQHINTIV